MITAAHALLERRPSWESSESALADLWQRTAGLPEPLVAQNGRRFRVLYPGRRSARAGPDFRDAILRGDDGRRVVGDVELHLRAPDWYGHSHHADPNYNGVVLHVVLRPKPGSDTRSRAGDSIPVVGLEAQAESLETAADAPPSLPQLSEAETPEELSRLLDAAGDERFLLRSAAFGLEFETNDPDQVLYAALMESLGYSANRRPVRKLAARVPFAALARLRSEPVSSRLLALEAALVGASGLLPRLEPDHREFVKRARALVPRARPMSSADWTHFRVRPTNHPIRRILGAARVFERYLDSGLARGLQADADGGAALLARRLAAPPYVGESRARDMLVNVALPFLHALASAGRSRERRAACLRMYAAHPKLSENEITREAARMLPNWGRRAVRGARRQQGLMLLYERMTTPRPPSRIAEVRAAYGAKPRLRAA